VGCEWICCWILITLLFFFATAEIRPGVEVTQNGYKIQVESLKSDQVILSWKFYIDDDELPAGDLAKKKLDSNESAVGYLDDDDQDNDHLLIYRPIGPVRASKNDKYSR
jgi:hypothetical protein